MDILQISNIILLIIVGTIFFAGVSLAPFVPSFNKDLNRINKAVKLKPWENFLEIWSGSARVSMNIAKNNPDNEIYAIELALPLYLYSIIKNKFFWYKNLKIMFGNALKLDFSNYDIIYIYGLIETVNNIIKPKILKEMKEKAVFISYVFSIKKWDYEYKLDKPTEKDLPIHIYSKTKFWE